MGTMLRAAVIGAGSMGSRHARIYAELSETDLVAVVDASEAACSRVATRHGAACYTDVRAMLGAARPDLVSIAVPTFLHREMAEAALDAGCHVLVEKPIAATVEEARVLIDAAERAKRKLMVGHIVRFDPAVEALKAHVQSGELGRIYQIVCRRIGPFPYRVRDVGVGLDLAVHDLDLMRYLVGEEPVSVYAETSRRIHDCHEDLLSALLRFPSGVVGVLQTNWLTPMQARDVVVLGDRGMFCADCIGQALTFYANGEDEGGPLAKTAGPPRGVSAGPMNRFPLLSREAIQAELAAFVAAILDNTDVPVTGADGLAALSLSLALIQSGVERRPVLV